MRDGTNDTLHDQTCGNFASFIEKTIITCKVCEKTGRYKNYELTLSSNYPVQANTICYVKKKNAQPVDINDGTLYYLGEVIEPGQTVKRIVRTLKNEYIRMFINSDFEVTHGIVQT